MICARCKRPLFRDPVQVQVGHQLLTYGPHCAVVLGYRLPPTPRAWPMSPGPRRRRSSGQSDLFEVRA